MDKGIKALAPEDEMGERNFSYLKEIQPIWDRNCISCHDGVKHPDDLKGELKVVDKQSKRKYTDSYLSLTLPGAGWSRQSMERGCPSSGSKLDQRFVPTYFVASLFCRVQQE